MLTKEDIRKKLQEDPDWTLPDDASDEDWDLYFEVKDEMDGVVQEEEEDEEEDSWDEDDGDF
jgi:hypothetical protein